MLTEFEGKIVKSLETIAECMVKSNEMAKEALKKSNQIHEANMAIMEENSKAEAKKDRAIDERIFLNNEELLKSKLEKEAEKIIPY